MRNFGKEESIYKMFYRQYRLHPNALALMEETPEGNLIKLSYRQLFQAVDKAAKIITDNCKKTNQPIGYLGKRTVYTVISYLAILKTGNIIVPVDEAYPDSYRKTIIKEAGIRFILTMDKEHYKSEEREKFKYLADNIHFGEFQEKGRYVEKAKDRSSIKKPYLIIFTSGTTGKPKGVLHNQEQIINYCRHIWNTYNFTPKDRICQRTSIGFIPSVWEIFLGLIKGFPTVILPDETTRNPAKFIRSIQKYKISIVQVLPSVLKRMYDGSEDILQLKGVKLWLTAGEPMPQNLLLRAVKDFPESKFLIGFGTTEVGGVIEYTSDDFIANDMQIPWYVPISNVKAYILDKNRKRCTPDTSGELFIGGPCIARGYINNTEGNRKNFIKNPFIPGEKIYRTGDLARCLPGGRIQPIGRRDNQVKIRGMRVDLQTIEQVLSEIDGLREGAIVVKAAQTGVNQLAAYFVREDNNEITTEEIKEYIKGKLPDYMVPLYYEFLEALPRLHSGKLDRRKLSGYPLKSSWSAVTESGPTKSGITESHREIKAELAAIIRDISCITVNEECGDMDFIQLGLDSVTILDFLNRINTLYHKKLEVTDLYDLSTINALAEFLEKECADTEEYTEISQNQPVGKKGSNGRVAIIGMSCRFPGAADVNEYWDNLVNGVCSVSTIPAERLSDFSNSNCPEEEAIWSKFRWGGFLKDIDLFDCSFFHLSQRECELMDPQHRLVLLESVKALEDAGYKKEDIDGQGLGVFIGAEKGDYSNLMGNNAEISEPLFITGCDNSMLAARLSYCLNLTGPSMTIDTACSSSLTAVHLAVENILLGNCSMAVAGGVHLMLTPRLYLKSSALNVLSEDGLCRAFDKDAGGFVPGEGVGIVVLKDLQEAIKDGDNIYGVILGSGINHNGKTNGITAPSAKTQAELIRSVYEKNKINPEKLSFIEAHGTGTKLGDPIEWKALKEALGHFSHKEEFCAVGSVKANIGHAITCAGIAGLIKVVLSIRNNLIPPAIHFKEYNEKINRNHSPIYVNTQAVSYQPGMRKTAAVSSFGLSGSNCHMVIGEYEAVDGKNYKLNREHTHGKSAVRTPSVTKTPFELKRCWFRGSFRKEEPFHKVDETTYCRKLLKRDLPLQDHTINGSILLSGAQQLSILQELGSFLFESNGFLLKSVAFKKALEVRKEGITLFIKVERKGNNIHFNMYPEDLENTSICDGFFVMDNYNSAGPTSKQVAGKAGSWIPEVYENTEGAESGGFTKEEVYNYYSLRGILYGESYRLIERISRKHNTLTAILKGPEDVRDGIRLTTKPQYLDAALHAIAGYEEVKLDLKMYLPFSAGEVCFHSLQGSPRYVRSCLIRKSEDSIFCSEIALMDEKERDLIILRDVVFRASGNKLVTDVRKNVDAVIYSEGWLQEELNPEAEKNSRKVLVFARNDEDIRECRDRYKSLCQCIFIKEGNSFFWNEEDLIEIQNKEEDIIQAFKIISDIKFEYSELVFIWSMKDAMTDVEPENGIDLVMQPLFYILKQIAANALLYRKIKLIYGYCREMDNFCGFYGGISGFMKSISLEYSNFSFKAIELDTPKAKINMDWLEELWEESDNTAVLYEGGIRKIRTLIKQELPDSSTPLKDGVYIITGGLGGIGYILADYILTKTNSTIAILGRTDLSMAPLKKEKYANLQKHGKEVLYFQADVSKKEELSAVLTRVRESCHRIDGILHLSGIIRDKLFINKSEEEFKEVIAPKVLGAINLDELTREDNLGFFMLFSSVTSEFGRIGQCDYAYANGFLDSFAKIREYRRIKGLCYGKTLSVNWPLWEEGGMQIPERRQGKENEKDKEMSKDMGEITLDTNEGINLWTRLLNGFESRYIIASENIGRSPAIKGAKAAVEEESTSFQEEETGRMVKELLLNVLGEELQLDKEELSEEISFEEYGINSFLMLDITEHLENFFGPLPKTLFFHYQNVKELADYFIAEHKSSLLELRKERKKIIDCPVTEIKADTLSPGILDKDNANTGGEKAVITGMAGVYPMSDNLEEFWDNLKKGKDCITEIPPDRWDYRKYYQPVPDKEGCYSKWGGFLKTVEEFDPLFFRISPAEAGRMDPQERIFLEIAWKAMEDAGYTREKLEGFRVGVYVGVMWGHYQLYEGYNQSESLPKSSFASIANRVSYFFNFNGPSIAIDTMCSSSLTALKLAYEDLERKEIDFALVGGVNLSLHPYKYKLMCQEKFASTDGKCRSFGEGGDGYVPGEGVGAVFLTTLSQALEDKAHIYGLLKAVGINHGGKTNGYTIPNPKAQAELIASVIKKAGISPLQINFIEAHGTGTALGDPIEADGLKAAFEKFTDKKKFCAMASIKSNIGHLEAAAGIASLTKVLLQMQYKTLVPTLHAEKQNPYIDFENTPVYLQSETAEWKRPESGPRCAGISSFGAGGSNAFVIIEEYDCKSEEETYPEEKAETTEAQIIILSAKEEKNLEASVKNLVSYIKNEGSKYDSKLTLRNMAYTLMTGREAMEKRLAVIASSREETVLLLEEFLAKETKSVNQGSNCFSNIYSQNREERDGINKENCSDKEEIQLLFEQRKLKELACRWVRGTKLDWARLFDKESRPCLISVPSYPFSRERYWIETKGEEEILAKGQNLSGQNRESMFGEWCFTKVFSKKNEYVSGHRIKGRSVLPGTVLLEMVREAAEFCESKPVTQIKNIRWLKSVDLEETDKRLTVTLSPLDSEMEYQVMEDNTLCAAGVIACSNHLLEEHSFPVMEMDILSAFTHVNQETFYNRFKERKLDYDSPFKTVQDIWVGTDKAYGLVKMKELPVGAQKIVLNPVLMDGILQVVLVLEPDGQNLRVPYAIEEIIIYNRIPEELQVFTEKKGEKYNLTAADRNNQVILQINGLHIKKADFGKADTDEVICFFEQLEPAEVKADFHEIRGDVLVFDSMDSPGLSTYVMENTKAARVFPIRFAPSFITKDKEIFMNFYEAADFKSLYLELTKQQCNPRCILFHWEEEEDSLSLNQKARKLAAGLFNFAGYLNQFYSRTTIKVLLLFTGNNADILAASAAAFLKNVYTENHKHDFKVVTCTGSPEYGMYIKEAGQIKKGVEEVVYEKGSRRIKQMKERSLLPETETAAAASFGGVYLITGGTGGLGRIFASYFAKSAVCSVIVTGRKPEKAIHQNFDNGSVIDFIASDVTIEEQVRELYDKIIKKYHRLDGILHLAGLSQDCLLRNKTADIINSVCKPKIDGTIYLDEVTKNEDLEFFITFSSLAALVGNRGQTDYAYANRFMDMYMAQRGNMVKMGQRRGLSLSINWPYWENGGMSMAEEIAGHLYEKHGVLPLKTQEGLKAFEKLFQLKETGGAVLKGNRVLINKYINGSITEAAEAAIESCSAKKEKFSGKSIPWLIHEIKRLVSEITRVPINRINEKEDLQNYGMDSVMFTELEYRLEKETGIQDSMTVFLEKKSIEAAAEHLHPKPAPTEKKLILVQNNPVLVTADPGTENEQIDLQDDIAVTGISGRYPEAENTLEFWNNIMAGKNCITKFPEERWAPGYAIKKEGEIPANARWGGFIKGVDKFDPLFFHISPAEAQSMDPQVRLMLEETWNCMEDAGYSKEYLQRLTNKGKRVGVFIGCMSQPYPWCAAELSEGALLSGQGYWSIPNRISHFLGINGPSMVIDTACSSSATAIYQAAESLRKGECDIAIAGGINLILHPYKYQGLEQEKMLSSGNISRSLGNGDGYIPAEGAGVIILRRKKEAILHNDRIYCLIRGWGINHSGGSLAFKVPSAEAIRELIQKTLEVAKLTPEDIGYYEVSASGLQVGDMAELKAIQEIFSGEDKELPYLRIGAVKSVTGHLEAASGIAQITKAAYMLRYKVLPPSVNSDMTGETLDFTNSPFLLQTKAGEWQRSQRAESPLRVMVNSIGAGGSNAVFLLEEYKEKEKEEFKTLGEQEGLTAPMEGVLLLLSAATRYSLYGHIAKLIKYMEENRDVPLYDLAFALARREALRERAAVIANSREECIELLHRILEESIREGKTFCASCYPSTEYRIAHPGEVMEELAVNWVTGINYQWDGFFDKGVLPLFLPGYVFEEEYCWSQNSAFKPDRKEVTGENAVKSEIVTIFSRVLRIPADKIEDNKPFHEFGLDSLKAMDILRLLNDRFTAEIPLKELFRNNTIASLLSYLKNQENFLKTKSTNYLKLESGYHVNASFFSTIEKMVLTGMREKKITVEQGLEIKAYILNLVKEG